MKKILVAKVLKPKGLKGEVKVKTFTNDLSIFNPDATLSLKDNNKLKITTSKARGNFLYLTFENIQNIEQAESLKAEELFADTQNLEELKEDEYYVYELIGFKVYNNENKLLGTLTNIENFNASDVYTLKTENEEWLFANKKGLILSVDIKNKSIVLDQNVLDEVLV
jgi:16S rRNA processing protein RimM